MELKDELRQIFEKNLQTVDGLNGELYVAFEEANLQDTMRRMAENNFELLSLFCAEIFPEEGFTVFYAFEKTGYPEIAVLHCTLNSKHAGSIAKIFASACWYEREITDGFGVTFDGAFDTRRLFLHENYPADFHPLLKSFKNGKVENQPSNNENEYTFREVEGEGVYQIPVGPVHAGIIETGHFRFSVVGETIFNLELRLFYKHRGLEKLSEGKTPEECVKIAETISGDESVANAVAFCNAIEKISDIAIPRRALQLRTILLELERIYCYLGDLAGMIIDVAYPAGASPFFILREQVLRQNEALTGSRFMKGIVTIGGINKDISGETLRSLATCLQSFPKNLGDVNGIGSTYFSLIDRFETTGKVKEEIISPLHITGPVARASGKKVDTRVDHPYGLYSELKTEAKTLPNGDVLSRFELKAAEILDSIKIIQQIINEIEQGEVLNSCPVKNGYALSLVESARGQNVHWILVRNGLVDRYKVRTASFCNWQAMEHAVLGNIVPDFPLINKSMNLSYAGTDM